MLDIRQGVMKPVWRNFILSPLFVVLAAAAGWTTGYFFTWKMSLAVRLVWGSLAAAAAVAVVLWALKGVGQERRANGH